MKLLFDQNLSFKLCALLADIFPDSAQVRQLRLDRAEDRAIWAFAKTHQLTLVTQDSDFADLAVLEGPPPASVAFLLRNRVKAILAFDADPDAACFEIY